MAPSRSPKQLRAQRTRRELLAAARQVFAQRGYEGATVEEIGRAAGCSKGAYYFHFASKEETLLALLDAWIADRSRRLEQAAGGKAGAILPSLAKALSWHEAGWEPELLVEFWSQAQQNRRVGERLARAYHSWQAKLAQAIDKANEPDVAPTTPSAHASAGVMLAVADGLVLQAWLRVAPARPVVAQQMLAALALLARPGALRRAG